MDKTLREYLQFADNAHEYVDKFGIALSIDELNNYVTNLHISIKNIQSVAKRIADVSNIINQLLLYKNKNKSKKIKIENIETYPTENDHAVLRMKYPEESKEIINKVHIPVKIVENINEIPVNNIYYINSLKQYAINISGITIKGNLGKIVEYQSEFTTRCEYGIKCKSFDRNEICKYYHDPEDYLALNKPVPDIPRNYTAGSWIYTKNKKSQKTYFARHIGNKDTLLYDIYTLKKMQYREEIYNREGQLIHDLLIYLILHNKGMLERYPHWF